MKDDQIKQIVDRFLAWKFQPDFTPDGGIKFEQPQGGYAHWPSGTNLLDARQAEAMIRHILGEP